MQNKSSERLKNNKLSEESTDDAMSFTTIQIFRMWPIGVDLNPTISYIERLS